MATDTAYVFIDGSLADLQAILSGLDQSVTAIVLDPTQDGIRQMADALAGLSGLDAIHLISHGSSGQINLGTARLSQDTLAQYHNQLATIGHALSATGDLLLYGCNVAHGSEGQAFISALANAAGADVAASTDLTGATLLGGDWQLEAATGAIETNALNGNIAGMLAMITGTVGNDTLTGTVNDDMLYGDDGDDTLDGGAGDDILDGGTGNDILHGGDGNDYLNSNSLGVAGNDSLFGNAGNDTLFVAGTSGINESVLVDGGDGDDLIQTALSQTYGNRTLTATGGLGIDTYQFVAYQFLAGDTIASFTVTDFTTGVGGDRIDVTALLNYYSLGYTGGNPFSATNGYLRLVQSGADTLLQYDDDGATATAYTFHAAMILQGVAATAITSDNFIGIALEGSAGDDTLAGGADDDILTGGDGDDILTGGVGDDILIGGAGTDTFNVDAGTDTLADAVPGTDIINISSNATAVQSLTVASVSYATNTTNNGTLVINALASTPSTITGSSGIDIITGSSAGDTLAGGANNDTLNGGAGNDVMEGGSGGDTYYVDSTGDSVVETESVSSFTLNFRLALDLGSNIDKVIASISYTLGNSLENLDLATGSGNLTGTGNALANVLTGNEGSNTLTGGAGNDTLDGGGGIDTAAYTGSRAGFTLAQSGTGFIVTESTGTEGVDTVTNIERLAFADCKLALDLLPTQNAGQALEFIGTLAFDLINTPNVIGTILSFFDQEFTMTSLSQLAIDVGLVRDLAGSNSNEDLARLVFRNVIGQEADASTVDELVSYMDGRNASFSQAEFIATVAGLEVNQQHIDLVGLQETGVEFFI